MTYPLKLNRLSFDLQRILHPNIMYQLIASFHQSHIMSPLTPYPVVTLPH